MRRRTIFANSSTSSDAAAATVSSITNKMTIVNGLSSPTILDNYDTFLIDMWGVMHDGHAPYDGVLHALRRLKEAGKKLFILSNSSKRIVDSEKMLTKLGFHCNDSHTIITSGEVAHRLLRGDGNNGYATIGIYSILSSNRIREWYLYLVVVTMMLYTAHLQDGLYHPLRMLT